MATSSFEGWRGLLSITPDQLERLTATKSLRFVIGHNKTEYTIHTGLLPPLSASLTALAYGELKRSPDGCVTLAEIDEDVFLRFMQFLYTGTYMSFRHDEKEEPSKQTGAVPQTTPSVSEELTDQTVKAIPIGLGQSPSPCATNSTTHRPSSADSSHSTTLFGGGQISDQAGFSKPASQVLGTATTTGGLVSGSKQRQSFGSLFGLDETTSLFGRAFGSDGGGSLGGAKVSNTGFGGSPSLKRKLALASTCDCGPSKKNRKYLSGFAQKHSGVDQGNDYCEPKTDSLPSKFSGHARIWVFANRFDITALMDLASSRLVLELAQCDIWPSSFVSEFGDLVRYVYKNCPAGECRLTQIVAQYAACVAEDMSGLSVLFTEVPAFAADVVDQMAERLG